MALKSIIAVATLALRAFASPVEPPQPQDAEDWALLYFRRACSDDQGRCSYSFLVSEDPAKAPKFCSFDIDAANGLPAYQVDFSLAKCSGAAEYSVNGGWDERGFVTLTVINDERNLLSFFAFTDEELAHGVEAVPRHSKVFIHPIPVKREAAEEESQQGLAYAAEWKLVDVVRYEFNRGTPFSELLIMRFDIESGDEPAESCHLQVPLYEGTRSLGKSFYGRECSTGGWKVSWGHNEATDEAVMTLINKNHDRHAYFGFNQVSSNVVLGANGPNPTWPLVS
ncbi:hypothetical protein EsH8_III_000736 [Colletotrichum jinshuiense]